MLASSSTSDNTSTLAIGAGPGTGAPTGGGGGGAGGPPLGPQVDQTAQILTAITGLSARMEEIGQKAENWQQKAEQEIGRQGRELAALGKQPQQQQASGSGVQTTDSDDQFAAQIEQALEESRRQQLLQPGIDLNSESEPDDNELRHGDQIDLSAETLWVWPDRWAPLVRGSAQRAERFQLNVERYLRPQLDARDWREVEHHLRMLVYLLTDPAASTHGTLFKDLRDRWYYLRESKRKGVTAAAATFDRLRGQSTLPQDVRDAALLSALDGQTHRQARAAQHQLGGRRGPGAGAKRGEKKQGGARRGGSGQSRPGKDQF